MIVRELVTRLGFDADETVIDKWDDRVDKLVTGLAALAAVAAAAGAAIVGLADETADEAGRLLTLNKATKETVENLQAMEYALSQSEVSAEALGSALVFMRKTTGKTGVGEFLNQLERIRNMKAGDQVEELMKVFGRGGKEILPLLAATDEELRKLMSDFERMGGGLTTEQVQAADDYADGLDRIKIRFKLLRLELGSSFIPMLSELVTKFEEWYDQNRDIIRQRIDTVFKLLLPILKALGRVFGFILGLLGDIIDALGRMRDIARPLFYGLLVAGAALFLFKLQGIVMVMGTVVRLLGIAGTLSAVWAAAMARVAAVWALLTGPLAILIAIATVVGLIIEDILVWQAGGDSLIGEWLGTWAEWLDALEFVVNDLKQKWADVLLATTDLIENLMGLWQGFKDWLSGLWDGFMTALLDQIDQVVGAARSAANFFGLGSEVQASATSPAGVQAGNRTVANVNQRSNVRITTPAGSTQEQVDSINRTIDRALADALGPVAEAYPVLEHGY